MIKMELKNLEIVVERMREAIIRMIENNIEPSEDYLNGYYAVKDRYLNLLIKNCEVRNYEIPTYRK